MRKGQEAQSSYHQTVVSCGGQLAQVVVDAAVKIPCKCSSPISWCRSCWPAAPTGHTAPVSVSGPWATPPSALLDGFHEPCRTFRAQRVARPRAVKLFSGRAPLPPWPRPAARPPGGSGEREGGARGGEGEMAVCGCAVQRSPCPAARTHLPTHPTTPPPPLLHSFHPFPKNTHPPHLQHQIGGGVGRADEGEALGNLQVGGWAGTACALLKGSVEGGARPALGD